MEDAEDILNLWERTGLRPRLRGPFVPIGTATVEEQGPSSLRLRAGVTTVEIATLAADLFRVGMFLNGRPPHYDSEAVARTNWSTVEAEISEADRDVTLSTGWASARIRLDPLRISFLDSTGRAFAVDDDELGMGCFPQAEADPAADPLGPPVRMYKRHEPGDRYFACGERTGGLEKTGTHQMFWNIDPLPGHSAAHNNLYTSIPFTLVLNQGDAWGMLFDNPTLVEFDLAREREDRSWFSAYCGDLVYYVFTGPTPRDVLDRYTELTGRTPMPPLWALGHHQSRYSYESANEVRQVVRTFRERDIPLDAIYLDIDAMDGYRNFTFDPEEFPEPEQFTAELAEMGVHTVMIVDAGVKVDEHYPTYVEGHRRKLFCQTPLGAEYHNVVWPGVSAFPDFTMAETREWWGEQHRWLLDAGIAGIWCDMNEPSLFLPALSTLPPEIVHRGGSRPQVHAQVHNTYGALMARATREGLLRLRPDCRPFVITRSGYAGVQRHAMQWTGDNSAWWEHLWMSMPQIQNMGLSGVAWCGVDIGGFFGDTTGELLARWYEAGIFQPFCRNHAAKDTRYQEPWRFDEAYESVIRSMVKLRQRLIPYIYTLFEDCHRTGAPIMRPLLFEYPDDETTYVADDELLLGDAILVAPITRPGVEYRYVYLPRGTWFHYWTGECIDGPAHILAHAPLGQPAIYLKANKTVPLWPEMSFTGERSPDPLTLLVYPADGEDTFTLYEDSGDGFDYQRGGYARRTMTCGTSGDEVTITLDERDGQFDPERTTIELVVCGVLRQPNEVRVDGVTTDYDYVDEDGAVTVRLDETRDSRQVKLIW